MATALRLSKNAPKICPELLWSVPIESPGMPCPLDAPATVVPLPLSMPPLCTIVTPGVSGVRMRLGGRAAGRKERWWLEYEPGKADYFGGQGRGALGGNSVRKHDWKTQMINICYKQKWNTREKYRHAFRKHGYELDVPKWGG
eukprot:GEMP01045995.1.p1 GENE.GEMP01045995.1~~GEMP01045995.1.p1  ORF type:complete len:143 (+),score=27.30 GEMP01045995.1:97-525(+)